MQIPLNPFNRLEDLVPADWREPVDKRALFISAYELQGIPGSEFPGYVVCDLKDVRVLFWRGELSHREDVKVTRLWIDDAGIPNVVDPEPTRVLRTPESLYTVFLSPFTRSEGTNAGEAEAEERIEIARALLAAFQGRNIAYLKVFENTYSFESRDLKSWSQLIPLPLSFPRPAIGPGGLAATLAAERARWSLPPAEQNRVELSLRWLGQAIYSYGVDGFLKYWFAIETLVMQGTSDIRPLNEVLATVYNLDSASAAKQRFHTGLLSGLRGQIVHDGRLPAIDSSILRFCEYLYHDVLRQKLGLPPERRLETLLIGSAFDHGGYLRSLLSAS